MNSKSAILAIVLIFSLIVLVYCARLILLWYIRKSAVKTKPNGIGTPADAGLEYECINIYSGSRVLQAWWVNASSVNDRYKAVLIFHGNDETISEWVPALKILSQNGISSLVFDYSGFGSSTGRATFHTFREDVIAAWKVFQRKAGDRGDKYLLALSLGTGILLNAYSCLAAKTSGVILIGTFSSIRGIALMMKVFPSALIRFLPDIYNNIQRVGYIQVPLLMVHSKSDELFPPAMAQQVYAVANEPKHLVLVPGLKHNDMLEGKAAEYLAPVIEFMKGN